MHHDTSILYCVLINNAETSNTWRKSGILLALKKENIAMEKSLLHKKICLYLICTKGDIVKKQLNQIVKTQEAGKMRFIEVV